MNWANSEQDRVEVEAQMLSDGRILPSHIQWRGKQYTVVDVGHQWSEQVDSHTLRCVLVKLTNGHTLELVLQTDTWTWYVRQNYASANFA